MSTLSEPRRSRSGAIPFPTLAETPRTLARVLIPAHNEAATIERVARGCREAGFGVTVIDDGSGDETARLALRAGAEVLTVAGAEHGKTMALHQALAQLPPAIQWIFCLDGDGQHDPSDLARFWHWRTHADMVVGNRFPDSSRMPVLRRWTNRAMSAILHRGGIHDSQCGFRLIRRAWLGSWLPSGRHFQFETELALLATARPCRVVNLPIAAVYGGEESKICPGRDAMNFARCFFRPRHAWSGESARHFSRPSVNQD